MPCVARATLYAVATLLSLIGPTAGAQVGAPIAVPPDSAHWTLEGKASVADYLGRRCIMLDG